MPDIAVRRSELTVAVLLFAGIASLIAIGLGQVGVSGDFIRRISAVIIATVSLGVDLYLYRVRTRIDAWRGARQNSVALGMLTFTDWILSTEHASGIIVILITLYAMPLISFLVSASLRKSRMVSLLNGRGMLFATGFFVLVLVVDIGYLI